MDFVDSKGESRLFTYSTDADGCHIAQEMGHGDWRLLESEH